MNSEADPTAVEEGQLVRRIWPLLVAAAAVASLPFVSLAQANVGEPLPWARLAAYWSVTVAVVLGSILLASLRSRAHARQVGVLVAMVTWLFFNVHLVADLLSEVGIDRDWQHLVGWAAVTVVAVVAFGPLARRPLVQTYVAILLPALLVMPAVDVIAGTAAADQVPEGRTPSSISSLATSPNIYFLVLDGYARADVIEDLTGHSITPFVDALEDRGFHVSDQALANYPLTFLSVASTLDMRYLVTEADTVEGRGPFYTRLRGSNEVVRMLRENGYGYVHGEPAAWDGSRCSGTEDRCIATPQRLGEAERALLNTTPAGIVMSLLSSEHVQLARQSDPSQVIGTLFSNPPPDPFFVFAHIMSPHPPFLREADCEVRRDLIDLEGWHSTDAYAAAVSCLNQQLLAAVGTIVARDPDAIIVIQGDHGPAFDVDFGTAEGMDERLPIFSAMRLPSSCEGPADDVTAVNTFRIVVACLSGAEPELLEDQFYWVGYDSPAVREVSPTR